MIDKKFIINRLGKVSKKGALMTESSRQWYFGILKSPFNRSIHLLDSKTHNFQSLLHSYEFTK